MHIHKHTHTTRTNPPLFLVIFHSNFLRSPPNKEWELVEVGGISVSTYCFKFSFFFSHATWSVGLFFPWPGIEPVRTALRAWSLPIEPPGESRVVISAWVYLILGLFFSAFLMVSLKSREIAWWWANCTKTEGSVVSWRWFVWDMR